VQLTVAQQTAVDLIASGQRDAEVAERVGVTRQTICNWRNHYPAFQAALYARRAELWSEAVDRFRALLPSALDVLAERLEEGRDARVALEVLKIAGVAAVRLADSGPTT